MSSSDKNFILLFLKIVSPIILIVFVSSLIFLKSIEKEKKELMYEKVQSMASLISTIYQHDSKHSATLLKVQDSFKNLNNNYNLDFSYLVGKKTSTYIEYVAYSSYKKPGSVKLSDINIAQPMRDALNGTSSVQMKRDSYGIKVFSAYTNIPGTPWALVIKQTYERHIEIFYKVMLYMTMSVLIVLVVLFFALRYYERKSSALIKSSEDRFRHLVESTYDWIWEVDTNGVYTYASHQIESILGYKQNEIIGKAPFDFMPNAEAIKIKDIFINIVKSKKPIIDLKNINIHKNGQEVVLLSNGTPFFNSIGKLMGYRGIDKNITRSQKKIRQMEKLAYFDSLTGLANRKNIINRIEEEVHFSLRNDTNSALIFLDLDGFKCINDSLGHHYGDEVLKIISSRLEACVREFDVVGRFGGDEFIILLRGKEKTCDECKKNLSTLIDRIIKSINQPIKVNDSSNILGASLGIAFIPQDGDSALEVTKMADRAMYRAKELGKNRAVFYDAAM